MAKTEGHGRKIKQEKVLQALKAGNTRRAAAAYAGVGHETFYRWLESETFRDAVTRAEAHAEVSWETGVAAAGKKDWRALAWLLERRFGQDWRERKDVNFRELSVDQLIALATAGDPGIESAGDLAAQAGSESDPVSG
jgi:hypothetical protein